MFRSAWVLIPSALVAFAARASEFDYSLIADAVERCEDRLVVAARKAPVVDETLGEYVARLSTLRRESFIHLNVSLGDPQAPFTKLIQRKYNESEDLRALSQAGLLIGVRDGQLDVLESRHGGLLHTERLREPIWRIAYHEGRLSLIGWSRTRNFAYANGRITVLDQTPSEGARPPARETDQMIERERLAAHARQPESPSLVLEATGELARLLVERARALCRGEVVSGDLRGDTYPNALLALAAHGLRRDPVMRNLIAGAINEHVHGEMQVEALFEESEVFALRAPACAQPKLIFVVPADPFRDPAGWGRLL